MWQHLFWFLAHPEVYVLVMPAMGVAEVIVAHTRRPLWGYGLMVAAVIGIGVMSMLVWAHHMFLTGMATTLSAFFQITTMMVSIPSVVGLAGVNRRMYDAGLQFALAQPFQSLQRHMTWSALRSASRSCRSWLPGCPPGWGQVTIVQRLGGEQGSTRSFPKGRSILVT